MAATQARAGPALTARRGDDGRTTVVSLAGAAPGRHSGTLRAWGDGRELGGSFPEWHGPAHEMVVEGLADRVLLIVDGDEHRAEVR
ncbi:MAG: hypothetical protein ACRD0D_00945 [Acidimicrobiales bacterium]